MKIGLFGTSANPPGEHHRKIVAAAAKRCDKVMVIPCGPRSEKFSVNDIAPIHRAVMSDLAFGNIAPNVEVDLFDLEREKFMRTWEIECRYARLGELWHIVGTDLVTGGAEGKAQIQSWDHGKNLWERSNFMVVLRKGTSFNKNDLPPHATLIYPKRSGASERIRRNVFERKSIKGLVSPEVEQYIEWHNLYRGGHANGRVKIRIERPRLLIIANQYSEGAMQLKKQIDHLASDDPNLIVTIGGDGTMLHAIQEHWRKHVPFLGINAGHEGFLLNRRMHEVPEEFFSHEFEMRHSPLLYIETMDEKKAKREKLAFNDAWMQALPGKTGWYNVRVNGKIRFSKLESDGVLVATAGGSGGYARAMGATPLRVGTELLVLVGSNVDKPHSWRHGTYLSLNSRIEFTSLDKDGWRVVSGFADNHQFGKISRMSVRISRIAAAELLFAEDSDTDEKLAKYQFPRN